MAESNNDIIKKRLQEKEKELEAEWSLSISYEKEVQKLKEQIQSLILCSTSPPSEPLDNSADIDKTNTELIKDWREQHGVTAAQISQLKVINLHAEERTGRNQGSAYGQSLLKTHELRQNTQKSSLWRQFKTVALQNIRPEGSTVVQ